MCNGTVKIATVTTTATAMKDTTTTTNNNNKPFPSSPLLEFAASDDLLSFKTLVEVDGLPVDAVASWYSRALGSSSAMSLYDRTPLMIAALYGSTQVLSYLLSRPDVDVNRRSDSDGATALHLAAAGGSLNSLPAVTLLLDSSADLDLTDYSNRRPGDVICKQTSKFLETILKASTPSLPCSPPPRSSSPMKDDEKKREYPPDLTLPDIKNGIYGTDEFRMYTFKVKPCSRAYSHDWTECPFVHPGENARRRDPRKYLYSCVPCPEFRKGTCRNGDNCEYAHGVFECWLHPAQYRTRLCKDETGCNRRVCFFAHKPDELRSVNATAASVNGLGISSPRGDLAAAAAAAAALMMSTSPMSPMSPSSAGMNSAGAWMNQAAPSALQLASSRLKTTMSARDLEVDLHLLGLEGYQQKLRDEIQTAAAAAAASSPRSPWSSSSAATSLAAAGNLFGSSSQLANQTLTQQLLSGYTTSNLPSSPTLNNSSSASFGLDHSMARAIMNSRTAAFAKRSQSFIDRGAASSRLPNAISIPPATTAMGMADWGSPDGKLDWGIQGEELNKLRKSASFGLRNNQSVSPPKAARVFDEPDLSWVQPLVKDGGGDMYSPWGEEQMVA